MTNRTAAPATVRVCAPERNARAGELLCWRMLSMAMAIVLAMVTHGWEYSAPVAIFGEHAGEIIEYVGEWLAKF